MNKLERKVYNFVKKYPQIKNAIVKVYQYLFSIIPGKTAISDIDIIVREGYFFGFHDKSPWSKDNRYLLCHQFDITNRPQNENDVLRIGYFKGEDWDTFVPVTQTNTWNWQTGAMLQWIGNTEEFIFNDYNGKMHIANRYNINGKHHNTYLAPISAVSSNGDFAVSHSFNRQKSQLGPLAYGYATGKDDDESEYVSMNEYLKIINLNTNEITNILSLKTITEYNPTGTMKDSYHYFTHCLFSPNGERLLFLHRWINKANQEYSRMFSISITGEDMYLFPTSGMVSHIAWKNDKEVLAYCEVEGKEQYYLLTDLIEKYEQIDDTLFSENGHPSYSESGLLVTDTYPNRSRYQTLLTYSEFENKKSTLAKLKAPRSFTGGVKCDLHPRWDRNGEYICFDSAHTGKRALCTIKIET